MLVCLESGDPLTHPPVAALESWVEAGGRLVISSALLDAYPAFAGLERHFKSRDAATQSPAPAAGKPAAIPFRPLCPLSTTNSGADCPLMAVRVDGAPTGQSFRVCDAAATLTFDGEHAPAWSLSDARGMHVIRASVGFGEITVLEPADALSNAMLKRAEHAEMFAAAAGLRHDDTLLIFHPTTAVPLPALLWRLVAPGILFLLAALLALAWRHAPTFGPPLPLPSPLRRSLAEQIRANARFAWRTRSLGGLRTSARRSLDEAAARQSPDMAPRRRAASGTAGGAHRPRPDAIRAARDAGAAQRRNEERAAITLMEVCRRILLRMHSDHPRPNV